MKPIEDITELSTRILLLEHDARSGLFVLLMQLVQMLESDEGCAITFVDVLGDGNLSVIALGNQSLVSPIMGAAAELHETLEAAHEGPIQ